MGHTYITEKINKTMGGLFSEEVLKTLDNIDTGFKYDIRVISNHTEFYNTYRKRITKFKNSECTITTSTIIDNYIVYKSPTITLIQGKLDEIYDCDNTDKPSYTLVRSEVQGKGIVIFISEKVSKQLDVIVNIDRSINIAVL